MDDPMTQLENMATDNITPKVGGKKRKRAMDRIHSLEMPLHCQLGLNKSQETILIDFMSCSTNQLWISTEAVPWFILYLAAEARSGGVSHEEEEASETTNCGVEGLYIAWDFQSNDAWIGTWLEGPCKGQKVTVFISKFTQAKYQLSAPQAGIERPFNEATREDLKAAARRFLLDHCASQLASSRSCGDAPP